MLYVAVPHLGCGTQGALAVACGIQPLVVGWNLSPALSPLTTDSGQCVGYLEPAGGPWILWLVIIMAPGDVSSFGA